MNEGLSRCKITCLAAERRIEYRTERVNIYLCLLFHAQMRCYSAHQNERICAGQTIVLVIQYIVISQWKIVPRFAGFFFYLFDDHVCRTLETSVLDTNVEQYVYNTKCIELR